MGNNKKEYLSFISRLTSLLSDYSPAQLNDFLAASKKGFSSLTPIIEEFISFQEAQGPKGKANNAQQDKSNKVIPLEKHQANTSGLSDSVVREILESRYFLTTNQSLLDFANQVFGMNISLVNPSRKTIIDKIIAHLRSLDPQTRKKYLQIMNQRIAKNGSGKPPTFFSQWEKIIKGL
jgi:hypothetical protein